MPQCATHCCRYACQRRNAATARPVSLLLRMYRLQLAECCKHIPADKGTVCASLEMPNARVKAMHGARVAANQICTWSSNTAMVARDQSIARLTLDQRTGSVHHLSDAGCRRTAPDRIPHHSLPFVPEILEQPLCLILYFTLITCCAATFR
jgi:hypothetical protein